MKREWIAFFVALLLVVSYSAVAGASFKSDWNDAKSDYKTITGKKHKPANWLFGTNIGKLLGDIDNAIESKDLTESKNLYNQFSSKLASYLKNLNKSIKKEKKKK